MLHNLFVQAVTAGMMLRTATVLIFIYATEYTLMTMIFNVTTSLHASLVATHR